MIYVVSGRPGSGTSMMMQCLMAGGLEGAFSSERDRKFADLGGRDSLYELSNEERQRADFPLFLRGCVFKEFSPMTLPVSEGYKVVFMRRDREAAFASYRKLTAETAELPISDVCPMRDDMDVREVHYERVIHDHLAEFKRLAGWLPIDPVKAAGVVRV